MNYGYKKESNRTFEETIQKARQELNKEEFGVLTEIDVKATLKKKINVDFDKYIILGACNPTFAHKALLLERDIGLLLPCNVIIYELKGKVYISAIAPSVAMGMVQTKGLASIANDVEEKLRKVIDAVSSFSTKVLE